jgi:hypothetical protein
MTKNIMVLLAILTIGCSSTSGECTIGSEGCECYRNDSCDEKLSCISRICIDNSSDTEDSDDTEDTEDSGDTDDGTGGDSQDGTGGRSVKPTGGSGGNDNKNSGGADSSSGGSGSSSGGSDNSTGGNNTCVPKTCDDLTAGEINSPCGQMDDGCGRELQCSCKLMSGELGDSSCGADLPQNGDTLTSIPQEPNLCGGGCVQLFGGGFWSTQCNSLPSDPNPFFSCFIDYSEEDASRFVTKLMDSDIPMVCTFTNETSSSTRGFCCE